MPKRVAMMLALAGLAALGWAFYEVAAYTSRGGEQMPLYSSQRYDPYGTAALRHLLSERGREVHTLQRPRLDAEAEGVLIQVLPKEEDSRWSRGGTVYDLPASSLADWIARGNTVIQMARHETSLMSELGVRQAEPQEISEQAIFDLQRYQRRGQHPGEQPGSIVAARPENDHRERELRLRMPMHLSVESQHWQPAWSNDEGVLAGVLKHGEGRLIVVGAPSPALNHKLGEGEHLPVLLEWVGPGPVIIDEWSHGVGHAGTIMQLMRQWGLLPVIVQVLLLVAAYHWSRRGYRRADREQPVRARSSVEQVQTLGHLLQQALSLEQTVERTVAEVHHRLGQAWRCDPARLRSRARPEQSSLDARMRDLLERTQALQSRPLGHAGHRQRAVERELAELLTESQALAQERSRG